MKEFSVQSITMNSLSHSISLICMVFNICKCFNFLNVNLLKSKSIHFFMNLFRRQEVIFLTSSRSVKIIGCLLLYHVHEHVNSKTQLQQSQGPINLLRYIRNSLNPYNKFVIPVHVITIAKSIYTCTFFLSQDYNFFNSYRLIIGNSPPFSKVNVRNSCELDHQIF